MARYIANGPVPVWVVDGTDVALKITARAWTPMSKQVEASAEILFPKKELRGGVKQGAAFVVGNPGIIAKAAAELQWMFDQSAEGHHLSVIEWEADLYEKEAADE